MIKVNKKINLAQLDEEFNAKGLIGVVDENGNHTEIGLAENNDGNLAELEVAISNHIAIDENQIATAAKKALLEKLGITEEEAKLLLG